MKVLFATSEYAPLAQTGGLGEAVSGLAGALAAAGDTVSCVLPAYRGVLQRLTDLHAPAPLPLTLRLGDEKVTATVHHRRLDAVNLHLLDIPALFDRDGIYGDARGTFTDNPRRFIAFSKAVAFIAARAHPDVLVAHDHHAALALAYAQFADDTQTPPPLVDDCAHVQVIHNGAYQGRAPAETFALCGLPEALFHLEGLEAYGQLCLLKAGLNTADLLVTVSPSYANELQTAAFGHGLEGLYRARAEDLVGIVNGLDTTRYDPATDSALAAPFSASRPEGKSVCRAALLDIAGLSDPGPGRLLGAVGRFAPQKGWDVLEQALEPLLADGFAFAVLGDGDPEIAARLTAHAKAHPRQLLVARAFDDTLARRIFAGADAILIPSRFEPCGLVQRIAQRYGTLPIAHAVGGLRDTIIDDGEANTGILFRPLDTAHLIDAVHRSVPAAEDIDAQRARLLAVDVSWRASLPQWRAALEQARSRAGRRRAHVCARLF